jgi:hypothetical protein
MQETPPNPDVDGDASTAIPLLIAHAKEYGILYAIAYFVAADLGLLVKVAEGVGGMC